MILTYLGQVGHKIKIKLCFIAEYLGVSELEERCFSVIWWYIQTKFILFLCHLLSHRDRIKQLQEPLNSFIQLQKHVAWMSDVQSKCSANKYNNSKLLIKMKIFFVNSHCWRLVCLLHKWLEGGFGRWWGHNSTPIFRLLGQLWYKHIHTINVYH